MSSSTCVVWKPQLFIQWTGSCELPPTSSLGHCTFGDKLSLSLLSCLFRDTRARSLPNALSSLARSCQTPFPCQSLHPNTLSPLYPERVDCSEGPSHTRSCRLLLHFFLVPDYEGCRWRAVNEFSSSTGSHVSPACVHWPFPLWNHTPPRSHLTHTHTPHILTSAIRVRSPDTGNCTPYLSGLICFSQSFWSLSAHSTNCWRDYWAGLPAGC